jgi:hypothetical protein
MAQPAPVDPLTVSVDTSDADRFADLLARTDGKPSPSQLQTEYIDKGGSGLRQVMMERIGTAEKLAATIAARSAMYERAIGDCLPVARASTTELRAVYLALSGLFPDAPLPRVQIVFGAGTSGGTAGPGVQVLGLEVLCALDPAPDKLRETLRKFFAHETVHTLQTRLSSDQYARNPLLATVLMEGAADFVATLITGDQIDAARAVWAQDREATLLAEFDRDVVALAGFDPASAAPNDVRLARLRRWVWNYGDAPTGWPHEVGYWVGQRLWQRWYDRQPDKRRAVAEMLVIRDIDAIHEGRVAR